MKALLCKWCRTALVLITSSGADELDDSGVPVPVVPVCPTCDYVPSGGPPGRSYAQP